MKRHNAPASNGSNRLAGLVLACFFLSGTTALIYEIIWMRMMSRIVGGAPYAVSTILVVFMGGMGLGSFLASRRADRVQSTRLIRVYGGLELAVGLYALLVPFLLMLLKALYGLLYNRLFEFPLAYNLSIFIGAVVLLSLPAVCMGATLPILCRFYVNRLSHVGTHSGRLYGLNTIGAALGSLLCGFWMINHLGVWGTMLAAVVINCTIGLVCLNLGADKSSHGKEHRKSPKALAEKVQAENALVGQHPVMIRGALIIIMVSGFCAMAYEVLWTKLLGLIVGPTTYSFTIVLVTFIVGLALGNLTFGRIADRTGNPIGMLVATQLAAALLALLFSQVIGNSQLFFAKLIYTFKDHFALLSLAKALVLFAMMIWPTFFLGAAFPLVARIYTRSVAAVGRSIGVAYTINTIGAVLGSFCAGFLLIPLIGKENGLRLAIGLQLTAALVIGGILLIRQRTGAIRWAALVVSLAAGGALCTAYPSWNRQLLAMGKYHRFEETVVIDEMIHNTGWLAALYRGSDILAAADRGRLVYYGDGIGGFTTVLKFPGPFGIAEYSMANSGKMDASSFGDMKTQTLLAHFPLLFSPDAKRVMVLGLASGITAGEVLHYPVEQLDVVDINDRVFEAARHFEPWNNGVLDHPNVRLILQDGMAHLSLTDTAYDVIISEPSNPWMAGMSSLFTKEFFEQARKRLTENGIYIQWFHCYQMDWPTFALIGRTFSQVFPQGLLVSAEPGGLAKDFLFVGLKGDRGLDWDAAARNSRFAATSNNIRLSDPQLLYRLIVSEDLRRLFGPGPINTDRRPLLEYAAPKLMFEGQRTQQALLQTIVRRTWLSPATRQANQRLRASVERQIDFAAYALSVHAPFSGMVDLDRASPTQRDRYTAIMTDYCGNNPINYAVVKDPVLIEAMRKRQIGAIQSILPKMDNQAPAHAYLAKLFTDQGMAGEAIKSYREIVRLDPGNATAHNDLGFMLYQRGEVADAIKHFRAAVAIRPNFLTALGNLALALLSQDQLDEAQHYFEETLRVRPGMAEAHYRVGTILYRKGQFGAAAAHLNKALRIAPDMVEGLDAMAMLQATATDRRVRNPKRAIGYARKACTLTDEKDPRMLSTLAVAYAADRQTERSRQTARQAIELARVSGREEIVEVVQVKLKDILIQ